jgi:hypothetical protein
MPVSATIIYGARSGIQKAVRRGDAALAKTCFDIIWQEAEHRKWLLWRMPVLVFEDCWPMAGELAKAQEKARGLKSGELKQHWLKFVIRLVIARKNQDAAWLWQIAKQGKPHMHPEFVLMRGIVESVSGDQPGKLPTVVLESKLLAGAGRELTDYEHKACLIVDARRMSGGMVGDQWNAIAAQVLIYLRGLPETEILGMLDRQKTEFAKTSLKRLESLPWYCFDMHTRPGKMANRVFKKNYATRLLCDEDHIDTAWFQFTSAVLGYKVLPDFSKPVDNPTWKTPIWLSPKEDSIASWYGVPLAELKEHWAQHEQKMKDLVEWAISKS